MYLFLFIYKRNLPDKDSYCPWHQNALSNPLQGKLTILNVKAIALKTEIKHNRTKIIILDRYMRDFSYNHLFLSTIK